MDYIMQIELGDWLSFLGIVLSILFYQKVRQRKIVFIEEKHTNITSFDFSRVENYDLMYRDEKLSNYLYILKGKILFLGDGDSARENIIKPVNFVLKDINAVWKSCDHTTNDDLIECSTEIDFRKLSIITPEIKSQDVIRIKGIYNSKEEGYKVSHRILDTDRKIVVIKTNFADTILFFSAVVVSLVMVLFALSITLFDTDFHFRKEISYLNVLMCTMISIVTLMGLNYGLFTLYIYTRYRNALKK